MTPGITTRTTPTTGTEASEVSMCGADEGSLSRRTDKAHQTATTSAAWSVRSGLSASLPLSRSPAFCWEL